MPAERFLSQYEGFEEKEGLSVVKYFDRGKIEKQAKTDAIVNG